MVYDKLLGSGGRIHNIFVYIKCNIMFLRGLTLCLGYGSEQSVRTDLCSDRHTGAQFCQF